MAQEDPQTILDAEIIYGALRRERLWQMMFGGMTVAAVTAIIAAAAVILYLRPPAPIVVPFDPTTGLAVPNASVEAISLDERGAVVQSLVYQYVTDRETYNQIDNDLRIRRALARSRGAANDSLLRQWNSDAPGNLPARYGAQTDVDVVVSSIAMLTNGRVQVRMRKRLRNRDGATAGNFTAIIGYEFAPGEERTLEAVWQNPLGFLITEYSITQDRRE